MTPYVHNVKFYETDKMSITHHSNYVRWMEEARVDFLMQAGCDYRLLEQAGISSAVVTIEGKFIKATTFADDVEILVSVKQFNGVKLLVQYEMLCGGEVVFRGESGHCFVTDTMKIVNLKKVLPDYYSRLRSYTNA